MNAERKKNMGLYSNRRVAQFFSLISTDLSKLNKGTFESVSDISRRDISAN